LNCTIYSSKKERKVSFFWGAQKRKEKKGEGKAAIPFDGFPFSPYGRGKKSSLALLPLALGKRKGEGVVSFIVSSNCWAHKLK